MYSPLCKRKLDSGKIITKKRVHIANAETVEKLKKKVQVEEYKPTQ
jgi:folate-dependent phosphoribosylglycinamide formyltransferase PurN